MRVAICDFPSRYGFPPPGYGGIERWLWAVAVGARRAGADVDLLGTQWNVDADGGWNVRPVRLQDLSPGSAELAEIRAQRYDLMITIHKYPSDPDWRRAWESVGCDVATFQHASVYHHPADTFDGERSRLYCYSQEMREVFAEHDPALELAVHLGREDGDGPATDGEDLVWIGRIDADKAPHIAVAAAGVLGRRIRLYGPVFDEDYVERHRDAFSAPHVELMGETVGSRRDAVFREAGVLVYTYARNYVEAGVATLGESLRAGTPVAALAWRRGTCVDAALCSATGAVALADPDADDASAALRLAEAIERAGALRAADVGELGRQRFDPERHFRRLAGLR
ncbi:glycosyltransferase [Kitasatospora purpeofusca]|uniref:glycosyltransferase n=1 Tax=Kitasatospora purpeofusca TaxID=67352 RepID=UPI003244C16D